MPDTSTLEKKPVSGATLLAQRIERKEAKIGIIGLGYVGLPLAIAFHRAGFSCTGFDIDEKKIRSLERGESYIRQHADATFQKMKESKRFVPTNDFSQLATMDAILICVPTPLNAHHEPDLSYIESTTKAIGKYLCVGQLVVLESTTYPGTTEELVLPILEKSGLRSGTDFYLAFSPEREDPGNDDSLLSRMSKVVGGHGEEATKLACLLYEQVVGKVVQVSSARCAEAVKLTENIFRSVNIALANEMKLIFSRMGIDVWEVINAAKTKPFGFMPFYPGPGVGGHCIPVDPFYLSWKAKAFGATAHFIELAGEINEAMPEYVVGQLARALNDRFSKSLKGSRILICGVAYKKHVDDLRESPALTIMTQLQEAGAAVDYHDPYIAQIPRTRHFASLAGMKSVALSLEKIKSYDASVIVTDHAGVDYGMLVQTCKLVVDTRNATAAWRQTATNIVMA